MIEEEEEEGADGRRDRALCFVDNRTREMRL